MNSFNYDDWGKIVQIWLDNDETAYSWLTVILRSNRLVTKLNTGNDDPTKEDYIDTLAETMKEHFGDLSSLPFCDNADESWLIGLFSDLLRKAFREVDWENLAAGYWEEYQSQ